jgi:predicted metal-dependent hydrolase
MAALMQMPAVEVTTGAVVEAARVSARESRDVTQLRDRLFGLTYAQMATAVAASPWFEGPFPSATEMVRSGLESAGRAEIERRTVERLQLAETKYLGETRQQRRTAAVALAAMWGSKRRFNRAHRIAEQVWAEHGTYADWVA